MALSEIQWMLFFSILSYGVGILFPILFYKKERIANIGSNILSGVGGGIGIIGSLWFLVAGMEPLSLFQIQASVSFITISAKLDALSAFFILILSILAVASSVFSVRYLEKYFGKRNTPLLNSILNGFLLSLFLVFTADNSICFFIAWEVMAVLSYFIVIFKSEQRENQKAGTLYIIMTHVGTAFLILSFMMMYSYTGSFRMDVSSGVIPANIKNWMFLFFLIGFGTKGGLVPFHIWLPHAYPAAPSNGSALMSGIMSKTAVYGMLRFVLIYLGVENTWWGITLLAVGMITVFIGISYGFVEKNIKRLIAYSSIENLGIIFIGLGIAFIGRAHINMELCALGLLAALVHTFNHGMFKSALFLGAGSIHYATGTRNLENLGGLIKKMPLTSVFFLGSCLAISAVVPLNGFIGEWLTYQSLFFNLMTGNIILDILSVLSIAALAFAGAMALAAFVKTYGIAFLGLPRTEHSENAKEVPKSMNVGIGFLLAISLFVGVFPMGLLKLTDHLVGTMIGHSIFDKLTGGIFFMAYPVTIEQSQISPLFALLLLVLTIGGAYGISRLAFGKTKERQYGTWDCGFKGLNARMQYTSGGYSKPLSIVFRFLFRPTRKLLKKGENLYHPERMEYVMTSESIFEKYLYEPFMELLKSISRMAKGKVQTGSIHAYLIYIFAAVLILMLYNRFV